MKKETTTPPPNDLPKLSAPAHRALAGAGIARLEDVTKFTEQEIKKLHGVGPNAINKLHEELNAKGWSFKK